MAVTMMTLGTQGADSRFNFSIDTAAYQELRRSNKYIWAGQYRLGSVEALQFMGREPYTLSMRGVIYPYFRGGLDQIDKLRAIADTGEPAMLTAGTGDVWGYVVITQINETQTYFDGPGIPRKIEFDLELREFVEE
jgi:phage protein U